MTQNKTRTFSKKACLHYHKALSDELHDFARLVEDYELIREWSEIESAATGMSQNSSEFWGYRLETLTFDLPIAVVKWPTKVEAALCRVSLKIGGELVPDAAGEIQTATSEWQMNLTLEAIDSSKKTWFQFWHFDRHLGGKAPPEMHPLFHANFGGVYLKSCREGSSEPVFTGLAELDSPRLQMAPLDAILLIDFVLSHFDGAKWAIARSDPRYLTLVASAQKRVWAPYVGCLADYFGGSAHKQISHEAIKLWPNLAVSPCTV